MRSCGAGDLSTSSPTANAANAKISPTTSVTAPSTAALAASSSGRRGTAASVARIIPEENSVVTTRAPRTPRASWPIESPAKLISVGSKDARSGADIVAQC